MIQISSQYIATAADQSCTLIVLWFNDTSTLVGHFFVWRLPEKGRKEREEIVEEIKERDREERGTGMKVKKQKKLEMCQYDTDAPTQGHPHPRACILQ